MGEMNRTLVFLISLQASFVPIMESFSSMFAPATCSVQRNHPTGNRTAYTAGWLDISKDPVSKDV
jgi:hypothetical protein